MPPLKVLKVGKIMWALNYTLSFKKMLWQPEEKKLKKKTRILTFFNVAVTFTLKERKNSSEPTIFYQLLKLI